MSLGDLPPRQKMINLMYLVLLCLLAMNVSKEILLSFLIINTGLERTTVNFESKINETYTKFERMHEDDPKKVGVYWKEAQELRNNADEIVEHINAIKKQLYMAVDQIPAEIADTLSLEHLQNKDNQDVGAQIMIGHDVHNLCQEEFCASTLKKKIEEFNLHLEQFIKNKELVKELQIPLEPVKQHDQIEEWEVANFYHLPMAATVTNLTRFQAAVRNSEADALKELMSEISADDFSFDTLAVKIIPHNGTYITEGDSFRADVIVAAYSTTKNPRLLIGNVDTSAGVPDVKDGDTSMVSYNRGIATYGLRTSGLGEKEWGGIIQILKPNGSWAPYAFKHKYMVAKPSLVVSPTAMNVFYKGLENPVDISVSGIPSEKLSLSVEGCSVRPVNKSQGKYEVVPNIENKSKEVKVTVASEIDGKRNSYPALTYRLKTVPKPGPEINGKTGSIEMTKSELNTIKFVTAKLEDFLFDLKYRVTRFDMFVSVGGKSQSYTANGNQLSGEMSNILKSMKPGQTVIFQKISAVMDKPGAKPLPLDGNIIIQVK
jgi:gliding motility-associated protein GldM